MKMVNFSLEAGNKYFARIDGQRFFVGRRVGYDGGKGLMNVEGTPAQKYDRSLYGAVHGFWADFLHPTAMAEGGFFHSLNTYDRACFTFSFLQFAAHVPDGDFVVYLRSLLALPIAADYFPDLQLVNGRVCRMGDDGEEPLETPTDTAGLMAYFNPTRSEVEDTEVIQSAKLIHWVLNDPSHRDLQVRIGVDNFRSKMVDYAVRYRLDGAADTVCLVVADIRHQGRAKSTEIMLALSQPDPLASLLTIGAGAHSRRLAVLRQEIKKLTDAGVLGQRRYDLKKRDFV